MVSNWASESTKDDEMEEDEDLWGMFTDGEEESEPKDVSDIDKGTQAKNTIEESEDKMMAVQNRDDPPLETEPDVIDELRQRLGRQSKSDESGDRLEALERRMQSRKNEESV